MAHLDSGDPQPPPPWPFPRDQGVLPCLGVATRSSRTPAGRAVPCPGATGYSNLYFLKTAGERAFGWEGGEAPQHLFALFRCRSPALPGGGSKWEEPIFPPPIGATLSRGESVPLYALGGGGGEQN